MEHDLIMATKKEARACFDKFKKMNDIDAVVLFSGTWVWAAHMIGAIRDFASTGKGIVLWTNPGSQGWRPVGGLVLQGALKEIGIRHRFVYGSYDDPAEIEKITSYCRASAMKNLSKPEYYRHIWRPRYGPDLRCCGSFTVDENFWH